MPQTPVRTTKARKEKKNSSLCLIGTIYSLNKETMTKKMWRIYKNGLVESSHATRSTFFSLISSFSFLSGLPRAFFFFTPSPAAGTLKMPILDFDGFFGLSETWVQNGQRSQNLSIARFSTGELKGK
ncbi:hypothetical protein TWF481_003237 [Arthrobotrys musiformis]|uniref:Uncharacterized protein n=1 Tax=Arthrobotrys musiformis TaxID=47236 RepID=A0AAV9VPN7_9PEZI